MRTTTLAALRTAGLTTAAIALSLSTLAATVAPAIRHMAPAPVIVDLPQVVITGHRAATVVELPPVFITGHRTRAMAIVDLPAVTITGHRTVTVAAAELAR